MPAIKNDKSDTIGSIDAMVYWRIVVGTYGSRRWVVVVERASKSAVLAKKGMIIVSRS